jgi:hypothetical protein
LLQRRAEVKDPGGVLVQFCAFKIGNTIGEFNFVFPHALNLLLLAFLPVLCNYLIVYCNYPYFFVFMRKKIA